MFNRVVILNILVIPMLIVLAIQLCSAVTILGSWYGYFGTGYSYKFSAAVGFLDLFNAALSLLSFALVPNRILLIFAIAGNVLSLILNTAFTFSLMQWLDNHGLVAWNSSPFYMANLLYMLSSGLLISGHFIRLILNLSFGKSEPIERTGRPLAICGSFGWDKPTSNNQLVVVLYRIAQIIAFASCTTIFWCWVFVFALALGEHDGPGGLRTHIVFAGFLLPISIILGPILITGVFTLTGTRRTFLVVFFNCLLIAFQIGAAITNTISKENKNGKWTHTSYFMISTLVFHIPYTLCLAIIAFSRVKMPSKMGKWPNTACSGTEIEFENMDEAKEFITDSEY